MVSCLGKSICQICDKEAGEPCDDFAETFGCCIEEIIEDGRKPLHGKTVKDFQKEREIAETICPLCNMPIGYECHFAFYKTGFVHHDCLERIDVADDDFAETYGCCIEELAEERR